MVVELVQHVHSTQIVVCLHWRIDVLFDVFPWHTVSTSHVATVGHRYSQIEERTTECILEAMVLLCLCIVNVCKPSSDMVLWRPMAKGWVKRWGARGKGTVQATYQHSRYIRRMYRMILGSSSIEKPSHSDDASLCTKPKQASTYWIFTTEKMQRA